MNKFYSIFIWMKNEKRFNDLNMRTQAFFCKLKKINDMILYEFHSF